MGQHFPNFTPETLQAAYAWAKDWQVLLAGLLALLAGCIVAIGCVKAARIIARGGPAKADTTDHPDLRYAPEPDLRYPLGPANDREPAAKPGDIATSLEQLRGLIRVALSSSIPGSRADTPHLSYERILRLQLDTSALPQDASEAMQERLEALKQHIETLRSLVGKKAGTPDIADQLIKINAKARELSAALALPRSVDRPVAGPRSA